jgi:hypothetical protein
MDPIQFYTLAFLSLSFETVTLALLNTRGDAYFFAFWVTHGATAVVVAWFVWVTLPKTLWRPRRYALSLMFLLALLFPLLGVAGLVVVRIALAIPKAPRVQDAVQDAPKLEIYAIRPGMDHEVDPLPPGKVARIAVDPKRSTSQRIRAVLALRDMPARLALPLLRQLLGDPDEEIRLLAYSIASTWEQAVTADLQKVKQEFEALQARSTARPEALAQAAKRVAELQMEFIYHGLAQGDLRRFALDQAWTYTQFGLQVQPNDPTLLMLQLRLAMARDDLDAAQDTLMRLEENASPAVWVPYAAELAWKARHFTAVRAILSQLRMAEVAPRLRPIMRLWLAEKG